MTVFVLKMHFRKLPLRTVSYRDFSDYQNANFINSLTDVLFEGENAESFVKDPNCFYKVYTEVLNQHAPRKKKFFRGNNKQSMKKALSNAIMQRTKLRNTFLKHPSAANTFSYNKQKNWCIYLLRKKGKIFCQSKRERCYRQQKMTSLNLVSNENPFNISPNSFRHRLCLVRIFEVIAL